MKKVIQENVKVVKDFVRELQNGEYHFIIVGKDGCVTNITKKMSEILRLIILMYEKR